MGHFATGNEVYRFIGRLFEELIEDPDLGPRFQNANTVVQYQLRDPDSQITVRSLQDEPLRVDLGPSLTVALARGDIVAKGPVAKILRLVTLVKPSFPRYQPLLREGGRADLVADA